MSELKRCPFCGSKPRTEVKVTQMCSDEDHIDFSIVCGKCGTFKTIRLINERNANFLDVEISMEKAINTWNQRAEVEEE